jgi:hypothetical protein
VYADTPDQLPAAPPRCLVIKSHQGSDALEDWLRTRQVPLILSVRDPRDAAISMALRFKRPLDITVRWIAADCARVGRLASCAGLLLRYEARFFERPAALARIAGHLGLTPAPEMLERIFARYETMAVRTLAAAVPNLPPERLTMVGEFPMDKETQILVPHIGDTRSGKWHALPPETQTKLTNFYRPFLHQFGYAA